MHRNLAPFQSDKSRPQRKRDRKGRGGAVIGRRCLPVFLAAILSSPTPGKEAIKAPPSQKIEIQKSFEDGKNEAKRDEDGKNEAQKKDKSSAQSPIPTDQPIPLEIVRTIPRTGYSEGLDFHDNHLWNALPKELLKISPKDGTVIQRFTPATDYSESITWFKGKLWTVSFSNNGLYTGTLGKEGIAFERVGTIPEVHAWGITHNGKEIITTGDYSAKLYFFNPANGKKVRELVTDRQDLEDLAWDGEGIWTSSFTQLQGQIFRIDPSTGKSSVPFILPEVGQCPVIDGIAVDGKTLWITGKYCMVFYQARLPKRVPLAKR